MEQSKWCVVITDISGNQFLDEFQVGICPEDDTDDTMEIVSTHDNEVQASAACSEYAKEINLPEVGATVAKHFACPTCGNRDMDTLIMDDDDFVTCAGCGTKYDPLANHE